MTKYAVLSKTTSDAPDPVEGEPHGLWKMEKMVDASNSNAAIKTHLKQSGADNGEYVAIPLRSWKPVKVQAETKVQITLS